MLFSERFRKQLQITDSRGFGLALQVTDQETDKVWGALSPDEETLAWVVEGAPQQLFLQHAQASGHERAVAKAAPGAQLRRLQWTPDGGKLIFTELASSGVPKLRCWDFQADREAEVPAPWSTVEGLGDLSWAGQRAVGVLRREGRQAVVAVDRDGRIFTLRPPVVGLRYSAPTAAADLSRVIYQDTRTRELTGAPVDGAAGGEAPLLEAGAAVESQIAVWFPDGRHVAVSRRDTDPAKVEVLGLPPAPRLLVEMEPPLAAGPTPTRFTFHLLPGVRPAKGTLRAVLVADDGPETVVTSKPITSGAAPVSVAPAAAEPGVHWLRVETKVNEAAAVRWYAYEVAGAP
ncbi:MAG: hypothetical protein HYU66_17790 [Armatimonadetes bacterium]|nr:hypothetical protein [Armatimonadota bacterium]